MNGPLPPTLPEVTPPAAPDAPRDSSGLIALRALLGFMAFILSGWLSVMVLRQPLALPILVVLIAIVFAVQGKWRGFALGVAIGVGTVFLLVGLCFAAFNK